MKLLRVKIGETIATYKNGKWKCTVPQFRDVLEAATGAARAKNGYAPNRDIGAALTAAMELGEVIEQPR